MTPGSTTGDSPGEQRRGAIPSSVHVLDSLEPGGAQNVVLGLAGWLADHGAIVTITGPVGPLVERLPAGVRFEPIRSRLPVAGLHSVLRRTAPQVVHAHQRMEALEAGIAGRLLGIRVVEHAHTVLRRTGVRALSFRSPLIFSVSDDVTTMITDRFGRPSERVVTVGNVPFHRSDEATTARPPRTAGPLRLVAIGRLVEQKDPLRFVRVVAALARRTSVKARWLGDGPLRAEAMELAALLGAPLRFVGASDAVVAELDASDALVMTSRWEGSPLVALEAFLRRRPVISTASSGVGLPASGRALLTVPDELSDDAFASAILAAFAEPERLAGIVDAAHDRVAGECVPDRVFGAVADGYRRLVRPARSR